MRITIQKIRFFSKNIPKLSEKSPKKFQNFQETREIGVFPPAQAPAAQLARLRRAEKKIEKWVLRGGTTVNLCKVN